MEQADPIRQRRATGFRPLRLTRSALALLVFLIVSIAIDLKIRFWILPRFRNDDAGRIDEINRLTRSWGVASFGVARACLGFRLTVEGTPPKSGRYLVLSNHQSSLDIPMLITIFRDLNLKFVAMERLRYGKPAVSLLLREGGFVFVKKELEEDLVALTRFGGQLERFDGSPAIFPEGGQGAGGVLRKFHFAGVEAIRRTARLPLLPVTLDGPWLGRTITQYDGLVNAEIRVRIGDPIPSEEVERAPRESYRKIEQIIGRDLAELRRTSGEG